MTVLWVLVAASVAALAGTMVARDVLLAAGNRVSDDAAHWRAVDCLARTRWIIDTALASRDGPASTLRLWRHLDRDLETAEVEDCAVAFEAVGVRRGRDSEPERIPINNAPDSLLATVPGFTPELVSHIAIARSSGADVTDMLALAARASPATRDSVMAHYPEIARLTTVDPDAWILIAYGRAGTPALTATIEARIVLANGYAAIVRELRR